MRRVVLVYAPPRMRGRAKFVRSQRRAIETAGFRFGGDVDSVEAAERMREAGLVDEVWLPQDAVPDVRPGWRVPPRQRGSGTLVGVVAAAGLAWAALVRHKAAVAFTAGSATAVSAAAAMILTPSVAPLDPVEPPYAAPPPSVSAPSPTPDRRDETGPPATEAPATDPPATGGGGQDPAELDPPGPGGPGQSMRGTSGRVSPTLGPTPPPTTPPPSGEPVSCSLQVKLLGISLTVCPDHPSS